MNIDLSTPPQPGHCSTTPDVSEEEATASPAIRPEPRGPSVQRYLPGDPDGREQTERMIRVDHAGEYGARQIYRGQLAILGRTPVGNTIRHMAAQEERHLAAFEQMVVDRRVRPTLLHPLWHAAGFVLGAATALMGERAAMACTVAVEEVIDEHYGAQIDALGGSDPELSAVMAEFRAEEVEHRDIGLAHQAEQTAGYEGLTNFIKAGSRLAIWLSERL